MIRLLGLALVVGSTLGSGLLYAASLTEELRTWEGLLRLARHIRGRIESFHQPLILIYADFRDEGLEACGFLPALREEGFDRALTACRGRLRLRSPLWELLFDFGSQLGKSLADDQLRHCDRCIAAMEEALLALRQEHPERLRLSRTLALSLAAMAVLLLL